MVLEVYSFPQINYVQDGSEVALDCLKNKLFYK